MGKVGGDAYLTQEPIRAECCGKVRAQNFYRYLALMFYIVREIDRSHTAVTEFLLNLVLSGQGRS